jgi:hypothetical protein
MSRILRVNNPDGDPIGTAKSINGLARLLESVPPGVYHIDEISAEPLPSGHTSGSYGFAITRGDSPMSITRGVFRRSASAVCDYRPALAYCNQSGQLS